MRMLLTSEGLTNPAIEQALVDMCFKPPQQSRVAFIPTSANGKDIDKRWLLAHLNQVDRIGFAIFDIVDIAALNDSVVRSRLESADVIVFGGGDTNHLNEAIRRTSLPEYAQELFSNRVYMGISAGAIVSGPDNTMGSDTEAWIEGGSPMGVPALNLTGVRVRPHFGRPDFPQISMASIKRARQFVDGPIYALSDGTAVRIVDNEVDVVGTGEWHLVD